MTYYIENIEIFGYHGVYDYEKKNGQLFFIDVSYSVTYNQNINTKTGLKHNDNIENVIDYMIIIDTIKNSFNYKRYNLLEELIERISDTIKRNYPEIYNLDVKISKTLKHSNKVTLSYVSK